MSDAFTWILLTLQLFMLIIIPFTFIKYHIPLKRTALLTGVPKILAMI